MKYRLFLFCFIVFSLMSCSRRHTWNELIDLTRAQIHFPELSNVARNNRLNQQKNGLIKFVIHYDSSECSYCRVAHLCENSKIFKIKNDVKQFIPIILFSPAKDQCKHLQMSVKNHEFQEYIYIDSLNTFLKINPQIQKNHKYNSFLLDKNNRIVLVGNPLTSNAMWALFKSTLDNMLSHDGVYVPE